MYSQGNEEKIILDYFGDFIGNCLSIGENDGKTYSNVLALIEKGWGGVLVEPSGKVFPELLKLHESNSDVICIKAAIGDENGKAVLHDSGGYLLKGTSSLLSTIIPSEKDRWGDAVIWEEEEVEMLSVHSLLKRIPSWETVFVGFNFINIDAEGNDLFILEQMNLSGLKCRCVCVEHNSSATIKHLMINYCKKHGLEQILLDNAENIIIAR